jgi:8-oxo-dGTP pyrophosphatase MutT (NUDIX family)
MLMLSPAWEKMPFSTRINLIHSIQSYQPRSVSGKGLQPAAVLVLIQEMPRGHYVTLIERAATLRFHSGEIAFPGGSVAPGDKDALAAALRESQEEIGIDPENVQIIGQLDQVAVASRYLVTPFVGIVSLVGSVRPNEHEVKSVTSIPVSALLNPECFSEELFEADGRPRVIYHFRYGNLDIWGATARILKQLLELAYGFRGDDKQAP